MKCEICGNDFKSLSNHVRQTHKIKPKEYYDTYLKKPEEGICEVCQENPTTFVDILSGYRKNCSISCAAKNKNIVEKRKQTNLEKYGVINPFCREDVKEKAQKNSHTKEASKKQWETRRQKYDIDPLHSSETKEKAVLRLREKKTEIIQTFHDNLNKFEEDNNCTRFMKLVAIYGQGWIKIKDQLQIIHKGPYTFIKNEDIPKIEKYASEYHGSSGKSTIEDAIYEFICSIYTGEVQRRKRSILDGKELDIYVPDKKLAIEVDGIFWHSTFRNKDKHYHINKTKECEKLGIKLIHITDWEWYETQDICESIIKNAFEIYNQKISANQCEFKYVEENEAKLFLQNNYINGVVDADLHYGLFYDNELVQLISIKLYKNKYELVSICNKLNIKIVDGLSTLLNLQPYDELFFNIDRSKFILQDYTKYGFELISKTRPACIYYQNDKKILSKDIKKYKLNDILKVYDKSKSEIENMMNNHWLPVYDCGFLKMKWQRKEGAV